MNQGFRQPFGSEYSVFQFATQKYKDYNLACRFICVWNFVSDKGST